MKKINSSHLINAVDIRNSLLILKCVLLYSIQQNRVEKNCTKNNNRKSNLFFEKKKEFFRISGLKKKVFFFPLVKDPSLTRGAINKLSANKENRHTERAEKKFSHTKYA